MARKIFLRTSAFSALGKNPFSLSAASLGLWFSHEFDEFFPGAGFECVIVLALISNG